MSAKEHADILVRLPGSLIERIDEERGDVERVRWIREVLAERVGEPELAEEIPGRGRPRKNGESSETG